MIKVIDGNVFLSDATFILHQVNCQGVMGSGVAKQVKNLYPNVYYEYKRKCNTTPIKSLLGDAQFVETSRGYGTNFIGVFNLFAQENFGRDNKRYTDYDALERSLEKVNRVCKSFDLEYKPIVAVPYLMGCDRGGGDWNKVCSILEKTLKDCDIHCYKLKQGDLDKII